MARTQASFPGGPRFSDHLGLGVIAQAFPLCSVEAALDACGVRSARRRDLPLEAMVYYVIAMGLFRHVSTREVLRCLADGLRMVAPGVSVRISGKSSISRARSRLGIAPFEELWRKQVTPLAKHGEPGARHWGFRIVALDSATLDLPDEKRNREAFVLPGDKRGTEMVPKARLALLMETGTRAALAWRAGPVLGSSELEQAEALLSNLEPGMLVLADCSQFGLPFWSTALKTGADLLWRVSADVRLHPAGEPFKDGSWPAEFRESGSHLPRSRGACRIRVVEYRLSTRPDESYRLATTLLDPDRFPACELASLYHENFEIENARDDVKAHFLGPGTALRSKTPELVLQEIEGLMLAHYAVRFLIHQATGRAREDPAPVGFADAVRVVWRASRTRVPFSPDPEARKGSRGSRLRRDHRGARCKASDRP